MGSVYYTLVWIHTCVIYIFYIRKSKIFPVRINVVIIYFSFISYISILCQMNDIFLRAKFVIGVFVYWTRYNVDTCSVYIVSCLVHKDTEHKPYPSFNMSSHILVF